MIVTDNVMTISVPPIPTEGLYGKLLRIGLQESHSKLLRAKHSISNPFIIHIQGQIEKEIYF